MTNEPKMTTEYRLTKPVPKLTIDGKPVIISELSPLDFYNSWHRFQDLLDSEQSILDNIKVFATFVNDILPDICNIHPKKILPYGFSVQRRIFDTFLAVNEDFLWMSDTSGVKGAWTMILEGARQEVKGRLFPYFLQAITKSVYVELPEVVEASAQEKTSPEQLPALQQSDT